MKQNRKLPPYAHRVLQIINFPDEYSHYAGTSADGTRLTCWVLVGKKAWDSANRFKNSKKVFIVIPAEENPEFFYFNYLARNDPLLLLPCGEVNIQMIKSTIVALMRDGVNRVLYLSQKGMIRFLRGDDKDVV